MKRQLIAPHRKPDQMIRYDRREFMALLNDGRANKSLNLKRILDLMTELASETSPKDAPALLKELNERLDHYKIVLNFASLLEPEWIALWPEEALGGVPLWDSWVVKRLPGFISSGDFKRLACCPGPGCGRFFLRRSNQTFHDRTCEKRAYRSTHKEQHRDYMRQWRENPAVGRRKR